MEIVAHEDREEFTLPGIAHRTLAGGLDGTDVRLQTMEPGADPPPHYHECGEAVMLLSGHGTAITEGREQAVGARETVTFEAGEVHQLVNSGEELELPWQAGG